MRNIVLVGFMGTGKTSVGKRLAERLKMPMIDTDDIIAEDSGMDIPDIFARYGEAHFRDLESAAVRKAANLENYVISTGGGVVLRESNLDMLKRNGVVFCLTATTEEIWRRVGSGTHRPLLQAPNPLERIEQMLIERRPFYARANHQIPTTELSLKAVTDEIAKIFQQSLHSEWAEYKWEKWIEALVPRTRSVYSRRKALPRKIDNMNILLIHGPNLQLLGRRQPEIYGSQTLEDINLHLIEIAAGRSVNLKVFQANSEGEIVSFIGDNIDWAAGVIINPAAYTHTSVAIRDALSAVNVPVIEIHLSNVHTRESFRQHSYISPIAVGVICGFGAHGYDLALDAMIQILQRSD